MRTDTLAALLVICAIACVMALGCAAMHVAQLPGAPALVTSRDGGWVSPGMVDRDSTYRQPDSVWVWYGGKPRHWDRVRWSR